MRNNASSAVEKLLDLQAKEATVLRAGKPVKIPLDQVKVGDLVQVKPGEKIAVDGIVVRGDSLVDESMVTGESMPIEKTKGEPVIGSTLNTELGLWCLEAKKSSAETLLSPDRRIGQKARTSHAPIKS